MLSPFYVIHFIIDYHLIIRHFKFRVTKVAHKSNTNKLMQYNKKGKFCLFNVLYIFSLFYIPAYLFSFRVSTFTFLFILSHHFVYNI